ncbi:MAG: Fic family protein [Planctomycetes bacterium]|nr:Fic family protein [Planctomycetota bacterium]
MGRILVEHEEDLSSAWSDPKYGELIKKADHEWLHWDKLRFVARERGLKPEVAWALLAFSRRSRYRTLPLRGHDDAQLRYVVPDRVQRELMLTDQELAGAIAAPEEHPIQPSLRDRFIIRAFHEEAIASSMLEGAATTRAQAKEMLRRDRKPRNRGEQMVLNNYRAINFIREHRATPLTPDFIVELQHILTKDTLDHPEQSGRLRTNTDRVVVADQYDYEVMHTPPPAGELPERLSMLCKFANYTESEAEFIHPVVKAIAMHFQIAFDHPFCDGNGRTARALFYWFLLNKGYWLFEYLPISRLIYRRARGYFRAFLLAETDGFDITYFINYNARIIGFGRRDLKRYLARKQFELLHSRQLLADNPDLNHRQREAITRLLRDPSHIISIADHQNHHRVSYPTARSDLLRLEERGLLTRRVIGNRFEFTGGPGLSEINLP